MFLFVETRDSVELVIKLDGENTKIRKEVRKMRTLVSIIVLMLLNVANAGSAKLSWSHSGAQVGGGFTTLTEFRVYWYFEGNELDDVMFSFGMPNPYKVDPGTNPMKYWSWTLHNETDWHPGDRVCFKMTALDANGESAKTGPVCKTFTHDPNAPILIEIGP